MTTLTTKEILSRVKKLEIKTKYLVDGLLQGAYHSIFHGRGIEFSEVREYLPGDDIRAIDWNVTARMGSPFIKEFIEERDLILYIVFDVSSSSQFGSAREKKEMYTEIAASIMFAALRNNDRIGLCLFSQGVEKFIRPKKGKKHVLSLIRHILVYTAKEKGTNLASTLRFLANVLKKRSIIFVISDFLCDDFSQPLKILNRRHDVIAIKIRDAHEEMLPDMGYVELEDAETGEQILVNTSDPTFRQRFAQLMFEQHSYFCETLKKINVDVIEFQTDQPYDIPLRKFFKIRESKKRR